MVVIIGATGFIGMYTTEAFLKKGEDVVATGRNKLLETVVIVMCLGHGEKDIPLRRMNQGISSLKEIMPFM